MRCPVVVNVRRARSLLRPTKLCVNSAWYRGEVPSGDFHRNVPSGVHFAVRSGSSYHGLCPGIAHDRPCTARFVGPTRIGWTIGPTGGVTENGSLRWPLHSMLALMVTDFPASILGASPSLVSHRSKTRWEQRPILAWGC